MRCSIVSLSLLSGLGFSFSLLSASAAYDLYWTESEVVKGADIDGGNETVVFDGTGMAGSAVDILVTDDHLYWTDHGGGAASEIWRAGRDGSNAEKITDDGDFEAPHFMALDEANDHIYFTDYSLGVARIDLDGGNFEWTFRDSDAWGYEPENYTGIYMHAPGEPRTLETLFNLLEYGQDGFTAEIVAELPGNGAAYGVAYDEDTETVYYTTFTGGALWSYNLNTEEGELLQVGLAQPLGVKLSPSKTHLLISERGKGISAFQLDNYGYELLVSGAEADFGVAVAADPADLPPGDIPGEFEPLEAPFTLDFGATAGKDKLGSLLIPERYQDWSIRENALRYSSQAGSWTDTAAVVEVENYEQGEDFFLESEVTLVEMGRDWYSSSDNGWQRVGFAVLGGPHTGENPFSQNDVGYKLLMMRGQLRLNDHNVGIISRENWNGAFENGAVYQLEASGVFDDEGRLVLTFTVTDHNGHSQTHSTDPIEDPHHGNLFGFFGRDRDEEGASPAYDYDYFSMSLEADMPVEGYASWAEEHFPGETNPSIIGPDADPDGDGIENLTEYALGLNPTMPDREGLPVIASEAIEGEEYLTLTYSSPDDIDDVSYAVRVGSEPGALQESAVLVDSTADPDRPGHSLHTYRDSEPVTASNRRFMQLVVEME